MPVLQTTGLYNKDVCTDSLTRIMPYIIGLTIKAFLPRHVIGIINRDEDDKCYGLYVQKQHHTGFIAKVSLVIIFFGVHVN